MKAIQRRILAAIILLLLSQTGMGQDSSGVIPLGNNEFDFLYDRLERSSALALDRFDWQSGPYRFDQLRFTPKFLQSISSVSGEKLAVFGSLAEETRFRTHYDPTGYESYRGGLAARPAKGLFVYGDFVLDQARAVDPTYHGKKWRGLAGDVEQAFASYQTKHFDLLIGRFGSFWGVRHSLVLGPMARMDGFGYTYHLGRLSLTYRLAALDGEPPPTDSIGLFINRYWAGHRLDLHLSNRLRVGVFEAMVWGGPGRTIEPAYLNPLLSFHTFQLNRGPNDNSFVGVDFDYKPTTGLKLYGQLLIDDFQIDKKSQGDQKPNMFGVLGGFYWADLSPKWDLEAEYSRVTNRTSNQFFIWNRYLYEGHPISAALGNDYDLATVSAYRWFGDQIRGAVNLALYRQGEGQITDAWTQPWLEISGPYHEKFPSGVVEKRFTLSLGLKGHISDYLYIDATAGIDRILNRDHIADNSHAEPFVNLKLSAFAGTILGLQ